MENIIDKIAKKNGVSSEHVRQEINKARDEMWSEGALEGIFSEKPSAEQFIYMFVLFAAHKETD